MQNITSIVSLKSAIQLLEAEQAQKGQEFKEQLYIAYESLRPVNLVKHALQDISSSPYLIDNILSTALGIASGFLTNKIFIGRSGNIVRNLLGTVLQFGVTTAVAQHPETIKSLGQVIMQYFIRRKGTNSQKL
jgi:hypothetical protein